MTIWKVCRLCLKEDENSLTEHTAANSLIETIFTLTSLQVLEFPIESVYLCEECEKLLVKFHLFRESCLANDIIFHQTVQAETLQRKDIVCSSHVELMKIEILSENDMEHAVFLEEDQVSLMEEENNSIKPRKISKPKSSAVKKISVQKIKQKTRGNNRRTTKADTSKKPTKDEVNLTAKATKRKPVQQQIYQNINV
ncbi:uncharacterized protein LOC131285598 [Anopheles ziemanni]|uniref:uncharacterized protein LOC131285598 n=1 Tax=Anopheles ziemanni TaxID=345580 RepID=UPI00265E114F|nr:uncharacterized protein LOC131285598 [Anopheles ziemanni]